MLADLLELDLELLLGIIVLKFFLEPETRGGDNRKTPPFHIGGLENLVHQIFCFWITFSADCPGIGIVDSVSTRSDLLDKHQESKKDIFGFKAGNYLRYGEL